MGPGECEPGVLLLEPHPLGQPLPYCSHPPGALMYNVLIKKKHINYIVLKSLTTY